MSDAELRFEGVWKRFRRGTFHDSLRDLIPAFARAVVGRKRADDTVGRSEFWALEDISFSVRQNQVLGIIGHNGAGKSTVLKILTGILKPTRGSYTTRGRVGALIEIAAGFHGDLTGRENMFLQGAIMGMSPAHLRTRFDDIVEFAGLEEFIDTPVKRYSTGMRARLGFSLAAHLDPDILIVDEVLSVGDQAFQDRAYGRIHALVTSGLPVVLVSHQLLRIEELSTEVLVLDHGRVVERGDPATCVEAYRRRSSNRAAEKVAARVGGEANPIPVTIRTMTPVDGDAVVTGGVLRFRLEGVRDGGELPEDTDPLTILVTTLDGNLIAVVKSADCGVELAPNSEFEVEVALQMNMKQATYLVQSVALSEGAKKIVRSGPSLLVRVIRGAPVHALVQLNPEMRLLSSVGSK